MKELEFKYKVLNPGGNKTAIVIGDEYTKEEKKMINDKVLDKNKDIEQVGFISTSKNSLNMAGGEFCVNASRCAVWEYLGGEEGEIELSVSGVKERLKGRIDKEKKVYIKLPIEKELNELIKIKDKYNFVNLEGILLCVIDEENSKEYIRKLKENEEKTKLDLREIMKKFETNEKAVGIILLEKRNEKIKINPIIWVKSVDTLYYETACGSGSLATAIYINKAKGINKIDVLQPSGYEINVNLNIENNYIKDTVICGKVMEEETKEFFNIKY